MSDQPHDNLTMLYSVFSEDAISAILPGDTFTIDGVEFVCKYSPGSTANRFFIVKNLELVGRYRELCERFHGGAMVELGIAEGGSTALLALLAKPKKLIAVDLERKPLAALAEFIAAHGLGDVVRPHYGVEQSDRERLGALVDAEMDGELLDVVFDDCSHKYWFTRSSFETLFPRLRPGGLYVIEDWNLDHVMADAIREVLTDTESPHYEERLEQFRQGMAKNKGAPKTRSDPLTRLGLELMVARSSFTDVFAEVSFDDYWIAVRRGTADLDPLTFRLDDHYHDHFGYIPPPYDDTDRR